MASKITSASEVNTGFFHQFLFLLFVKASLSTYLKVAMNVRMFQVIRMSAVVFFGQIQSRKLVRHVVRGIPQCSKTLNETFHSAAIRRYKEKRMTATRVSRLFLTNAHNMVTFTHMLNNRNNQGKYNPCTKANIHIFKNNHKSNHITIQI